VTKRLNYVTRIINLNDTIKTTWEIVKLKMGRKANNGNIHPFKVASRMINNQNTHNNINSHTINDSSTQFMSQISMTPYTNIIRKPTSIKEIEKLMKSLTSQKIHMRMMKFALSY